METSAPKVVLASLPWATYAEPSLGLATLKAELDRAGIACRVRHLNLRLLRYVSAQSCSMLATFWGINEFLFTGLLDGELDDEQAACLAERCAVHAATVQQDRYRSTEALLHLCLRLRDDVMPQYLAECADDILASHPTLVGFTCMFDQTIASVALARLLKMRRPDLPVILGGYALEGIPGDNVLRSFPWIDAVARGDGEPQIARLAWASVGKDDLARIPGIQVRAGPGIAPPSAAKGLAAELNRNPPPDYTDWFADLDALRSEESITVHSKVLPVEASRGCWWGQHKHCVFCGIDEDSLRYRAKSSGQVLAMLDAMRQRYGDRIYRFSDYILPRQYYHDMLDRLSQTSPRLRLMGEIKANQSDERLGRFAAAGFVELQPGIESFSSEVLKLMDKGVRGIHNVLTLKSGYRHGIQINYNILYGLPGEQAAWYRAMLRQLPKLYHLTPPVSRTETIVTRFAPLQADPARFGLSSKPRHHRCYDVMFSQAFQEEHDFRLDDYAYYFARGFEYPQELGTLYRMLVEQVDHWKAQHRDRDVYLYYVDDGEALTVHDSRFGAECTRHFDGLERRLLLACDDATQTLDAITLALPEFHRDAIAPAAQLLADEYRLLWREGEHYLSLAVPEEVWQRHIAGNWPKSWTANYC
ncbi:RiPP maturation radical SAM C-methyltransferase [Massilia timonae]|uniref:Bacteriocin maturation radical SAM 1 family protein n=1 Tax=Massilia timonae TaxID=47229 RepID=A0A1S2NGC1_9BURK|nr:RiPP maturation radical SAM C-methyltransferase [Massilia timonae]OIJ43999.1 bacteriocin maturation radical SAM 1 family protein [Massilia timonae]